MSGFAMRMRRGGGVQGIPLLNLPIGALVKFGVNGVDVDHIIAHHGKPSAMYDDSFNGATILLMKDFYEILQWHTSNVNNYANSTIHSYLNSTFLNLIDTKIKGIIKQVKIPYRPGSGSSTTANSGANGLPTNAFLLSGREVGSGAASYMPGDGATLDYFAGIESLLANARRIAYFDARVNNWHLRSPYQAAKVWAVATDGKVSWLSGPTSIAGIRPALVLPDTTAASPTPNPDGSYNLIV